MEQSVKARGAARCPGPSTRDIILGDGDLVPERLVTETYEFLGDRDLGLERYTSEAFFRREMKDLWPRVWQWACREEHIPEPGDYITYEIGPFSVIIVRGNDGRIRAFRNSCPHRGTQFRQPDSCGSMSEIRCPFHGWTFDLEGRLKDLPCRWDFPHVSDDLTLSEVRADIWGGFVFINLDRDCPPLREFLGVLPDHLKDGWSLENRYVTLHVQKELNTNWKAAQEAFLEAYHVIETHAEYLPVVCDANAQYDIYGDHVSRFVHTQGVPSPHYEKQQTQQEILNKMLVAPDIRVPEGETARAVAARVLRDNLSKLWDVDLTGYSTSEMLDSIEYFLFPNACFFPGVTLPMVYRFRPMGLDPGRTLFDLMFLRPLPPGMERPEPPEPVRIAENRSFTTVPGMDPTLGHVYDQDTSILSAQWRGMHAGDKPGATLGNYQEIRIRHMHRTLDKYLAD